VTQSLNILFLTPKVPYPPTDGGRIAVFEPLRHLSLRGHHITLLSLGSRGHQDLAPLRQYCRLEVVEHNTANRFLPALLNLLSPIPYTISKYNSEAMARRMRRLLASEHFDLVHIEHLHMGHYLPIAKEFNIPVLLRQHNVESMLVERFWQKAQGIEWLYAWTQLVKLRHFEAKACEQADVSLTITDVDAERLRQLNARIKTAVVPAGVDTDYYRPIPDLEESNAIVFVGSMDWRPNVDAVMWFCDDILPRIERQVPGVKFYIVGKNPLRAVQRLADRGNVVVTGFVEDVREYFARGTVFVVPLRIGSGMRLKILQAMAMGRPVVSTSMGAEGIRATNGQAILLADEADTFAEHIVRLMTSSKFRVHIGDNARKVASDLYSWSRIVNLLETIYTQTMQR